MYLRLSSLFLVTLATAYGEVLSSKPNLTPESASERMEADFTTTNRAGIHVSQLMQTIPGGIQIPAIIIAGHQNRLAFRPPFGWRVQTDASHSSIRLVHSESASLIVLRVFEKQKAELTAEAVRSMALKNSPNARILEEITISALNGTAPAIDFELPTSRGIAQRCRSAAIPYPGGYLECHLMTSASEFGNCAHAFNQVLLSLRHASRREEIRLQPAVAE